MNNQIEYFEQYKNTLYNLLLFCKDTIPYYKTNWDFDIPTFNNFTYEFFNNTIPILEKKIIREDSKSFLDSAYDINSLSVDTTSGTEGKPIVCYRSKKERVECSRSLWKFRCRFVQDIRPSDKMVSFYVFRNQRNKSILDEVLYQENKMLLPLSNLNEEVLKGYWDKIIAFKPRWMHGPSSTIYCLALAVEAHQLPKYRFDFIELSGEYVSFEQSEYIKKVFQTKVADQYGCREYWPIAYSQADGRKTVNTDNIFIEQIYNENHNKNELIITFLKNNAWPLVRYRIGDIGYYIFENNKIFLTLEVGRRAEFFILGENKCFNAILFSGIARSICEYYQDNVILQFQIIKESAFRLKVLLRLQDGISITEVMEKYKGLLKGIVGEEVECDVQPVKYIEPDVNTGKTNEFVNIG